MSSEKRAGLVRPAACPMNFVKCLKSAEEGRFRLISSIGSRRRHYSRVRTASSLGGPGSHFKLGPFLSPPSIRHNSIQFNDGGEFEKHILKFILVNLNRIPYYRKLMINDFNACEINAQ